MSQCVQTHWYVSAHVLLWPWCQILPVYDMLHVHLYSEYISLLQA